MKSQIFEANAFSTISLVGMALVIVAGAGAGGFTEADCRTILLGLSFAESKVDWSKNIQKCFTNIRAVKSYNLYLSQQHFFILLRLSFAESKVG